MSARPSMLLDRRAQRVALGAFLRESSRLKLTRKLAARLAGVTPQALYSWENAGTRRMRRKSGRQIVAATRAMRECKRLQRTELIAALDNGNMSPFLRLRARTEWFIDMEEG